MWRKFKNCNYCVLIFTLEIFPSFYNPKRTLSRTFILYIFPEYTLISLLKVS